MKPPETRRIGLFAGRKSGRFMEWKLGIPVNALLSILDLDRQVRILGGTDAVPLQSSVPREPTIIISGMRLEFCR